MPTGGTGLTRKGWAVLLIAGALLASGVLFGIQELYPIGAAVLVSVVAARAWAGAQTWDLRVARHVHPARVPAGEKPRSN